MIRQFASANSAAPANLLLPSTGRIRILLTFRPGSLVWAGMVYTPPAACVFTYRKGERIYKTQIHGAGLSASKRGKRPLCIPRGNTETPLFAGHLGVHLLCAEVLLQCGYIEKVRTAGAQVLPQVFLIVISEGLPID